jgi:hypothetical protein
MKRETRNKINIMEKKKYTTPQVQLIALDNEISLALQSGPPEGPGETVNSNVEYFNNNNSFKA